MLGTCQSKIDPEIIKPILHTNYHFYTHCGDLLEGVAIYQVNDSESHTKHFHTDLVDLHW